MNSEQRRKLRDQYKQRRMLGGVYRIRNTVTGRFLLAWEDDLVGAENRLQFSQQTGGCSLPWLREDWNAHGPDSFVFERLEELEQKETQTREEFLSDLETLLEMWEEKTDLSMAYKK